MKKNIGKYNRYSVNLQNGEHVYKHENSATPYSNENFSKVIVEGDLP